MWQALYQELKDQSFSVITVALDKSADDARPWIEKAAPAHPALIDTQHVIADLYNVVNVPTVSDSCWNAPLPCTAYPNPALRLRRDGDLGSGFMLDPVLHARLPYEPGAPWVPVRTPDSRH